jgi:hypothetical protein
MTIILEPWRRAAGIKLELVDVARSAAKAQFVAGK